MVRRDVVTDLERVVECTFDALLAVHIIDDVIATGATWLLRLLLLQVLALCLLVGVRTGLVIAVSVNGCRRINLSAALSSSKERRLLHSSSPPPPFISRDRR